MHLTDKNTSDDVILTQKLHQKRGVSLELEKSLVRIITIHSLQRKNDICDLDHVVVNSR